MTAKEILKKLSDLKPKFKKDGIIIVGLFGSYARGDNTKNLRTSENSHKPNFRDFMK